MEKKKFKMPHSYVIIFILLIAVSFMTYPDPCQRIRQESKLPPATRRLLSSPTMKWKDPVPCLGDPELHYEGSQQTG